MRAGNPGVMHLLALRWRHRRLFRNVNKIPLRPHMATDTPDARMPPVASRYCCCVCGKKRHTHPGARLHLFPIDARRSSGSGELEVATNTTSPEHPSGDPTPIAAGRAAMPHSSPSSPTRSSLLRPPHTGVNPVESPALLVRMDKPALYRTPAARTLFSKLSLTGSS
ncbi:hypothetical protein GWK47_013566 [Chionoecetes opilio]|uniref:Uncharacterized protein n=1 Tax=Chionoecetes opilio TaxID=41210 RepID=A0A8J5CNV6_CHIOP|nr:hypothetical protein GWK47_013566 [Chionoecetes opilio]